MENYYFSEWLQGEMEKLDMSQADLARRSRISKAYISRIINNQREPSAEILVLLASALNLPSEEVFRAAGLLSKLSDKDRLIEELLFNLSHLNEEQREQLVQYSKFLTEQRGEDGIRRI